MTLSSRKQRADGARTRERILAEALPLFAARGFAGTSVRQVAAAAEVNVATLAYHFSDKQGLYDAVVSIRNWHAQPYESKVIDQVTERIGFRKFFWG